MNVNAALKAGTQLAEGCQPSVGALNYPPMASESVIALDASAGDTILNTAALEVSATPGEVVALVRMQLGRPSARPARLAAHGSQGVYQLLENHRIMAVGPGDAEHQRDALAVRDEVALARNLFQRTAGLALAVPGQDSRVQITYLRKLAWRAWLSTIARQ